MKDDLQRITRDNSSESEQTSKVTKSDKEKVDIQVKLLAQLALDKSQR